MDNNFKLSNLKRGKETVTVLYDVEKGPGEKNDIASQYPEIVEQLQKPLRAWQVSVETSLTGADDKK